MLMFMKPLLRGIFVLRKGLKNHWLTTYGVSQWFAHIPRVSLWINGVKPASWLEVEQAAGASGPTKLFLIHSVLEDDTEDVASLFSTFSVVYYITWNVHVSLLLLKTQVIKIVSTATLGDLIEFSYPIGYSHWAVYDKDGYVIHFAVAGKEELLLCIRHILHYTYVSYQNQL